MKLLSSSILFLLFATASLFLWEEEKGAVALPPSTSDNADNLAEGGSLFFQLLSTPDHTMQDAIVYRISQNWKESYEIFTLESYYFTNSTKLRTQLFELLLEKTNQRSNRTLDSWFQYIWNKKASYTDDYFEFKANIHKSIDKRFEKYFKNRSHQSLIRLDEVRWGGVLQDGIPPLRQPKMIGAKEATYLKDSNIVFGIEVNGEARAYPKRILAWHEMFVDTIGGIPVAGVYCTLCGTVILYKTEHEGINHELGTSGFLYRSNKLMYDKATQSLWSTLEGKPVIGPLVNKGIELDFMSVVTTTWGQWKELHPNTSVLSLNTGHQRDYGEGVAYKEYFATDDLMFTVPKIDASLKNKDEILALRLPRQSGGNLAISSKFLRKNTIFHSELDGIQFVVFTDRTGAHRTYFTKGLQFKSYDKNLTATDEHGQKWTLSEERMANFQGAVLERFPTHNAFWFGYKAAFPDVKLIN
ncbi:MAG: DUF3179 domain-containing protein [Bacteroidota bacterium]